MQQQKDGKVFGRAQIGEGQLGAGIVVRGEHDVRLLRRSDDKVTAAKGSPFNVGGIACAHGLRNAHSRNAAFCRRVLRT